MKSSLSSRIHAANSAPIVDGDLDAVGKFFTQNYVGHLTDRDLTGGHRAVIGFLNVLKRAFPSLRLEVEILVEGTDRVAWQRTLSGIHEGELMGFPATGREIVWRDMVTSRFTDGLIAEDWVVSDLMERLLLARKNC